MRAACSPRPARAARSSASRSARIWRSSVGELLGGAGASAASGARAPAPGARLLRRRLLRGLLEPADLAARGLELVGRPPELVDELLDVPAARLPGRPRQRCRGAARAPRSARAAGRARRRPASGSRRARARRGRRATSCSSAAWRSAASRARWRSCDSASSASVCAPRAHGPPALDSRRRRGRASLSRSCARTCASVPNARRSAACTRPWSAASCDSRSASCAWATARRRSASRTRSRWASLRWAPSVSGCRLTGSS